METRDAFAGLEVRTAETVGRYSQLQLLALQAQEELTAGRPVDALLGLEHDEERLVLGYNHNLSLMPVQCAPEGAWRIWFFCGGRGAGKTHAGSCAVINEAMADPEARILIVGPTWSEILKHQLEGPSGILKLAPPWFYPHFKQSRKQLHFPNGAVAFCVQAQDADKFRGGQYSFLWLDEIVAWKKNPVEVLKQCLTTMRFRTSRMERENIPARAVVTTTPKATALFRELMSEENRTGMVVSRSSTLDNAGNLDPGNVRMAVRAAASSPDGAQEFLGELIWVMDSTIYRSVRWDDYRVAGLEEVPPRKGERFEGKKLFDLVVVCVDPATGEENDSDTHGVVIEGIREEDDETLHTYVLQDRSLKSPDSGDWVKAACEAFHAWKDLGEKVCLLIESNTGGSQNRKLVQLHDATARPIVLVRAGRGTGGSKADRARPVAMLAAAGYVHMVGKHHELEKQLEKFTGEEGGHSRDDRADAFAWPIFRYVARSKKMRGTVDLGTVGDAEGEEPEE